MPDKKILYVSFKEPHVYCVVCGDMAAAELKSRDEKCEVVNYFCVNPGCENLNRKVDYAIFPESTFCEPQTKES